MRSSIRDVLAQKLQTLSWDDSKVVRRYRLPVKQYHRSAAPLRLSPPKCPLPTLPLDISASAYRIISFGRLGGRVEVTLVSMCV